MLKRKLFKITSFKKLLLVAAIFAIGAGFGHLYLKKNTSYVGLSPNKAFISEIYDKIKENYWDSISDEDLLKVFSQALGTKELKTKDQLLPEIKDAKIATTAAGLVLANLRPAGRSGLYTQKNEQTLKNIVENIDPQKDLYKDLGLAKGASESAVSEAYQKKSSELEKKNTSEAKEELKKIAYAKDTLTIKDTKQRYDQKGVEPTIFSKIISSSVLYVQFKKFSPTSLDEFVKAFEAYQDNSALTSLVFDLRGNIGGAIDASAYFLGHFIGKNQYAFDFYKKGGYLPFKTPTDKLPSVTKFKQVVMLVDNNTQSSAELMAVTFKKYHVGVVLGVPTKGWGTVERVFPLDNQINKDEKYSIFLVHSITLRDDNQPIEGRGVEPDINITDSNWQQQLFSYFRNQQLSDAIKQVIQN